MSVGTAAPDLRRSAAPAPVARTRALLADPAVVIVAALTLLGALLRFWRIGYQGFWFDEGNTALLVHFSPGKMLGLIPQTESTPPLYYCVAWVWARVFGYGEAALRSLSAVAGVAMIPVVYGAGAKLISRRAGVLAAAFATCSPLLIWYSQEARSYQLLALLAAGSLLGFACALARPTRWSLGFWVVASALALGTHYYAVLAVAPEAVWLVVVHRRRRSVQIALGIVALCGLALIPLAISQHATGNSGWIARAPFGRRLGQVVPQFAAGFDGPAHPVLEPVAIAVVVLSVVLLVTRSDRVTRRGPVLAGGLALAGLALSLILVVAGFDDLLTRNMLAIWAPAALFVAGGLSAPAAPGARALGLAAAVVLCAVGLITAVGVALDRDFQRPDWRVVASALGAPGSAGGRGGVSPAGEHGGVSPAGEHGGDSPAGEHGGVSPAGGRAILVQHYRDLLPLSLSVPGLHFWRGGSAIPLRELDVVSFTAPPNTGFCWWGAACNLWPSRMQSSYPVPGFHAVSERRELQFTILRLVSAGPVRVTPAEVSRVLSTTNFVDDELLFQR